MGLLVNGQRQDAWYDTASTHGRFVRSDQEAYEEAVVPLLETLDWLESRLYTRRYLLGSSIFATISTGSMSMLFVIQEN